MKFSVLPAVICRKLKTLIIRKQTILPMMRVIPVRIFRKIKNRFKMMKILFRSMKILQSLTTMNLKAPLTFPGVKLQTVTS